MGQIIQEPHQEMR